MNFNNQINEYADFLNQSFRYIYNYTKKIQENEDYLTWADQVENGYLQFMWEIMVESELRKKADFLEPYGDGADFYGTSSRVIYPKENATKKIVIFAKNSIDAASNKLIINQPFDFIKLIHFDGQFYCQKAPFDHVLCENGIGKKFIFKLNEIDFLLEDIEGE